MLTVLAYPQNTSTGGMHVFLESRLGTRNGHSCSPQLFPKAFAFLPKEVLQFPLSNPSVIFHIKCGQHEIFVSSKNYKILHILVMFGSWYQDLRLYFAFYLFSRRILTKHNPKRSYTCGVHPQLC